MGACTKPSGLNRYRNRYFWETISVLRPVQTS